MKSNTFDLNNVQIMSSDEALLINGGAMILSDPAAFWNNASQAAQYLAEGWNSFCAGFNQGYEDHRK